MSTTEQKKDEKSVTEESVKLEEPLKFFNAEFKRFEYFPPRPKKLDFKYIIDEQGNFKIVTGYSDKR